MISLRIQNLIFRSGQTETLDPGTVVVLVGPNSSGKSKLLAELHDAMLSVRGIPHRNLWLEKIEVVKEGDETALSEWFEPRSRLSPRSNGPREKLLDTGSSSRRLTFPQLEELWRTQAYTARDHNQDVYSELIRLMIVYMTAGERAAATLENRKGRNSAEAPTDPIHYLWDKVEEELAFSALVKRAFGFDVCINRHQFNGVSLLKGISRPGDDTLPPADGVIDYYGEMPLVAIEGDGVKAFITILLTAIKAKKQMVMIDEPETFLHPPQARLIGRYLVGETEQNVQVITATHSADVLQGVLDGRRERPVKIIRLSREDGQHQHQVLSADRLETLWDDPIVRYSGLLNGLFHEGIVLCEADNDCRFYSAVLDAYLDTQDAAHDLVFTQLGGKGRFDKAVADMRTFGVRTAVIGDIDVLREPTKVKQLVTAAGGDFEMIKHDLIVLNDNVKSLSGAALCGPFQDAARPIMKRKPDQAITAEDKAAVGRSLKGVASGWDQAKRAGIKALTDGGPAAADRILAYLRTRGIFLVPVGELERWFPMVNTDKGASYVNEVLERRLHEEPSTELHEFIGHLVTFFQIGESTP